MSNYTYVHEDLLEWIKREPERDEDRFHAFFGDPPYFLGSINERFGNANAAPAKFGTDGVFQRSSRGFMGKQWDGFESPQHFQAWVTTWAAGLIKHGYPGSMGLFFGGSRTHHRLMAGLEDAGWVICDVIFYLYGVGFPKNHSISKAIDRKQGNKRKALGQSSHGSGASRIKIDNHAVGDTGIGTWDGNHREYDVTAPGSEDSARWSGHGTALKPAYEPVILCRIPRGDKTFADLALTHGTGAMNIDGTRIGTGDDRVDGGMGSEATPFLAPAERQRYERPTGGRWPANVILDDVAGAMLDRMSGESTSAGGRIGNAGGGAVENIPTGKFEKGDPGFGDTGGASRFFYSAKANAFERVAGLDLFSPIPVNDGRESSIDNPYQRGDTLRRCTHPTMKPIELCTYLSTMLLPPPLEVARRICIPFAGVASEMIGAHLAGWDEIVGVERDPEYVPQAHARLQWWTGFTRYGEAKASYQASVRATPEKITVKGPAMTKKTDRTTDEKSPFSAPVYTAVEVAGGDVVRMKKEVELLENRIANGEYQHANELRALKRNLSKAKARQSLTARNSSPRLPLFDSSKDS